MGALESVPQYDITVHDDGYDNSFRRVHDSPSSATTFRHENLSGYYGASPTRKCMHHDNKNKSRSVCNTSSTEPPSDCDEGNYDESNSEGEEKDCWGGPVLKNIISLLSPHKMNAVVPSISFNSLSSREGTDGTADHDVLVVDRVGTPEQQCQLDLSQESWSSPTGVDDMEFHPPNLNELPRKRLNFDQEEEQYQRFTYANDQDIPLPCANILPSKCSLRHQHGVPQQHGQGPQDDIVQHYDTESEISHLEDFLTKYQPTHASFESEHAKATALHKLGILQWKVGRYFFSEHALTDCIYMYQHLLDGYSMLEAEVQSALASELAHVFVSTGRVHLSKGDSNAAMHCYRECVQHLSSIPKDSSCSVVSSTTPLSPASLFAQACVGAGRALASQGKLKASLKRYKRALKVQLDCQEADSPIDREDISALPVDQAKVPLNDVAETLSHLGRLYEQHNDLDRAMKCHTLALSLYQSVLDPFAVDIGYALNNIGQLYLRLGHILEAEDNLKRSHHVFSLRLGKSHRNTADALLSIGQLYASQGKHKKALSTYKRVLRTGPAVFGRLLALTLHLVAVSYQATFRLDKAFKYYQREVNVLNSTLPPYHLDKARLLHLMAKLAMTTVDNNGDFMMLEETADWLREAAAIYHNNEGKCPRDELPYLEADIEETRKRIRRKKQQLIHYT